MEILNMTSRRFNSFSRLELPRSVFNTEAEMYVIPGKAKWERNDTLLKKFYNTNGPVFSNKLYTINELLDNKGVIDIPELVMPSSLAAIDGKVVGYTMPFIPNINFQEVMDSNEFSAEQKIAYLKEIGELLEKIKQVREHTTVQDFYLNDIHENNFVLNQKTGRINVVDLDSCKIGHNLTAAARYLTPTSQLPLISKYTPLTRSVGGVYKVSENTEIYCYIIMIFNYLFGANISKISISDFYVYLEYLAKIGVSKEFLDKISYIYVNRANENPYEYLDELTHFVGRAHRNVFERVRKK